MKGAKKFHAVLVADILFRALVGLFMFYLSIKASREVWPCFVILSSFYIGAAVQRISFLRDSMRLEKEMISCAEKISESIVENAPAFVTYEDKGQMYKFVVRAGDNIINCYSNHAYLGSVEEQMKLMDILVEDGKISLEGDMQILVEVKKRRLGKEPK